MTSSDRTWMYKRRIDGFLSDVFVDGVERFIEFALSHESTERDGEKMKCPCKHTKCCNRAFRSIDDIKYHLCSRGFVPDYYIWSHHGETNLGFSQSNTEVGGSSHDIPDNNYVNMVQDAAGPEFHNMADDLDEAPNSEAKKFFDMLNAAKQSLYPGCQKHTQLSFASRLMNLKAENGISHKCFDQLLDLIKEIVPEENKVADNFYESKKLLRGMGLPVEKIDCCRNSCMLYWRDDSELDKCKFCQELRYKPVRSSSAKRRKSKLVAFKKMYYFPLTPRLQRLYASPATAKDMRWHAEHVVDEGVMRHPSESEAWKHFDHTNPEFASENRNIRLGLCTDGFQPFGSFGSKYSSWPVIVTPYNLPPWMCMKEEYMFLSVLVPGPKNPKHKLDLFLQPLIEELNQLWTNGANSYDVSRKQNFTLRAALMWTISDFPAYSMLSGWSTAGRTACPYCMERSDAFTLRCSRKQSWFDNHRKFLDCDHPFRRDKKNFRKNKKVDTLPPSNRSGIEILAEIDKLGLLKVTDPDAEHVNAAIAKKSGWRKRSIFWDLPYWSTNLIRHNLDVMHIEKNVFDNVFNTVMNVKGKTKDTSKSRDELNDYCYRPSLRPNALGLYPKASFTLDRKSKTTLCEWVKSIKFPDGYASNLGRCVDMTGLRLYGMKSHDCHVFMQRLIPIAFRELLPGPVWKALTELSLFFKDLSARVIQTADMVHLGTSIPLILCQLERIFPPSFFDSMEHLPIHLPYEARIAGPVQYRWMYPFERFLRKLKCSVRNKSSVEGSIANAYLISEASTFTSYYFEDDVLTKRSQLNRNEDVEIDDEHVDLPSIFSNNGEPFSQIQGRRWLTDQELEAARRYVLYNCEEVEPFVSIFTEDVKRRQPNISDEALNEMLDKEFPSWFLNYIRCPSNNVNNKYIRSLAYGPSRCVAAFNGCKINGYRFHTNSYGSERTTSNMGVCIKGSTYGEDEYDYYGRLVEIVRLEYPGPLSTLLFKCDWFDPTPTGTKVHAQYKLVDVNQRRKFNRYEPFVLASQAVQVYYCAYPSLKRDMIDWLAACKIKARATVDYIEEKVDEQSFQEDVVEPRGVLQLDDVDFPLIDLTADENEEHVDVIADNELLDDEEDELNSDEEKSEDELNSDDDTSEEETDDEN